MFKEMRRQDRSIDNSEAIRVLEAGEYGILSTTGSNGYAYGVPISYTYSNDSIYLHCAVEGQKLENIKHNNKVSFCVVGETTPMPQSFSVNYESVVVFGKAVEIFESEKQAALEALVAKYSPAFTKEGLEYIRKSSIDTRMFKIEIEHLTGKGRR
jgi:nitroimidazol reductase NimA-like FMN-containing flavoprotein (pyridoxamine 5'-phosphate oxidase superfamily)